jgi:hypothetical protein
LINSPPRGFSTLARSASEGTPVAAWFATILACDSDRALKSHQIRKQYFMDRLKELDAEAERFSQEIRSLAKTNSALQMDKLEFDRLQKLADEVLGQVERWRLDSDHPRQVKLIQPAAVEFLDEAEETPEGANK